jgi:hypothetical protein
MRFAVHSQQMMQLEASDIILPNKLCCDVAFTFSQTSLVAKNIDSVCFTFTAIVIEF